MADGIALATITISVIFLGSLLWDIIKHLAGFIDAINATTPQEVTERV